MYLIYGFNYISSDNNIKRFSAKNIPPPMLKIYFTTYANILFMKIFDSNFKNFLPSQIQKWKNRLEHITQLRSMTVSPTIERQAMPTSLQPNQFHFKLSRHLSQLIQPPPIKFSYCSTPMDKHLQRTKFIAKSPLKRHLKSER